jgi:hypothetical protein
VIWFSGSFPLNYLPDNDQAQEFQAVADFQDDVRKTTDLLARNRVALYPVDGRGLFNNAALSGAQNGKAMAHADAAGGIAPRSGPGLFHTPSPNKQGQPGTYSYAVNQFATTTNAEHATMIEMADETGGKAFFDTNGLKEAIEKAVDDGSNYYTLAYAPPDQKLSGGSRRIEVKIDRPGLHLSYRRNYFADDPDEAWRGKKVLPETAMQGAMMFGSPESTQILLGVQLDPEKLPVDKASEGTKPNPKLMKPPYRRYNLVEIVDAHNLLFKTSSDGVHHAKFEFAAVVYDAGGQVVNTSSNRISLDFPPDRYAQILERGLRAGQTIEAPLKGDYFLRVGVYDANSDRVGAVEIPTSTIKTK